jgi:hypothetical protein
MGLNMVKFPIPIDTTPEDQDLYYGLGRQDLDFHQAIAELIDNSISARCRNCIIECLIEKDHDKIKLTVADNCKGIIIEDLSKKILRLGGRGTTTGDMNEHGFGLKNSLCVLTGNTHPFLILTRDKKSAKNNLFLSVKGPFRRGMEIEKATETAWKRNLTKCIIGDTGTRVYAETTYEYFKSLYPRATSFDTLILRLMEHLGVFYRGYLKDKRNQIWIRYRDISKGRCDWIDYLVDPIEIPYLDSKMTTIKIKHLGKTYEVSYTRGTLNFDEIGDSTKGEAWPLKIYYQKNQATQGIDIMVRGRVILPHQLDEIFADRQRHPTLNEFVGEIVINHNEFRTVNNKTKLDPHNPLWQLLKKKLNDDFLPPTAATRAASESRIRSELKKRLEALITRSTAREEFPTWGGAGVLIDILHKQGSKEVVYEIKKGNAKPQDVYQLVMYWDGRVKDGTRPTEGFLLAEDAPTSVMEMIEYWNSRNDAGGSKYKLTFQKIESLLGRGTF